MSVEETQKLKDELAELTGLILGLGPFCVEFAFSRCVCVGCLWVLWLPTTIQKPACEASWELKIIRSDCNCERVVFFMLPCNNMSICPGCPPLLDDSQERL